MELSYDLLTIGSYIVVKSYKGDLNIGKVVGLDRDVCCLHQDGFRSIMIRYCDWDNSKLYPIPFNVEILKNHDWIFNERLNVYTNPSGNINIYINELNSFPYTVCIKKEDEVIGHLNFSYIHELQSFCTIYNISLGFKFGIVNYMFKNNPDKFKI